MKKNLLNLMSVLFVTLAVFTLASCGDDDDDKNAGSNTGNYPHELIGSWSGYGKYFTFNANGTGVEGDDYITWYINPKNELVVREGDDTKIFRYNVNGDILYLDRLYDDDREHYELRRTNSGGGGTPSGAQIDQRLLGVWVGTKTEDDDTYTFTFTQNGEGNKKEFNQHEGDLDFKTFTWSINTDGQLVIRERGDNRAKIYSYVVEGNRTLILTRLYDDDYDVYHLER